MSGSKENGVKGKVNLSSFSLWLITTLTVKLYLGISLWALLCIGNVVRVKCYIFVSSTAYGVRSPVMIEKIKFVSSEIDAVLLRVYSVLWAEFGVLRGF